MSEPVYNCTDIDLVLCDYLDNALPSSDRAAVDRHLGICPDCAAMVGDSRLVLSLTERCATVEPPPELLTRIMHSHPASGKSSGSGRGLAGWLKSLIQPVMQPRFAMGMAMTILSFSMLGKFVGPVKPLKPEDLNPMSIVATIDVKANRLWNGAVKYYESLRVVYEIQTRLHEWNEEEQQQRDQQQKAVPDPNSQGNQ